MFVRGIVVHDQVQVERRIGLFIDQLQELDPFLVTMFLLADADDLAFCQVDGCEQRGRAVPLVVVGLRAASAGVDGQAFLRAVQGLNLRLLVAAQHQGMLGRIQIQADNVAQLLRELRIVRKTALKYLPGVDGIPSGDPLRIGELKQASLL